jgi:hypothetical protein
MTDNQPSAERAKPGVQLSDTAVDEFHPAVIAGQPVQDFSIENENAIYCSALFQDMVKRCMLNAAKVSPEPYKRLAKLEHNCSWGRKPLFLCPGSQEIVVKLLKCSSW